MSFQEQESGFYTVGMNAVDVMLLTQDAKSLSKSLRWYLHKHNNNIKFNTFYDKVFLDNMKSIIKDPERFHSFLNEIEYSLDDFLHIAVYVCPQVFTTSINKFIQSNYL